MRPLDELQDLWLDAKADEKQANEARLEIEKEILRHFKPVTEGTQTIGAVKVTFKVSRKINTELLRESWDALTPNAQKCFKWSADVALTSLRALQDMDAPSYLVISAFITESPSKPSISINKEQ